MATLTQTLTNLRGSVGRGFNWRLFLEDNITGSWYQTVWVALLALATSLYTVRQLDRLPLSTLIFLAIWLVAILLVVVGALRHKHNSVSRWLKDNLFTSVANTVLTLFVVLVLANLLNGIWTWAVVNATFDPERTAPEFRTEGATWGILWGARKLLLTGRLEPQYNGRVWLSVAFIAVMWGLTFITGRPGLKKRLRNVRLAINTLWILSPVILYIFLAGVANNPYNLGTMLVGAVVVLAIYLLFWWQKVINFNPLTLAGAAVAWPVLYTIWWGIGQSELFTPINVDNWGGFMLTLIIASSVIILSLPLGMVLALARRSQVFGIPAWIVWPVAVGTTIYFTATSTPGLLDTSRNTFEQITSFWPLAILLFAYFFMRFFQGNMVAGASTTFIELIRSVPLITLLFMGINMAPFFLSEGASIAKPWPVIIMYTLFSSSYMAETIRGGLQAIPKGQYEAADALGFNTLQKMRFIILPQALRIVIPAIVGQFIGAYKSSSLVSIVGLFDFLGIGRPILANERWFGLRLELYVFMGLVYFLGSFIMSSYSRRLETRLGTGDR